MSKERFEVFGNVIKDNEDIPSLLNNYQATVRLNELNDRIKELEQELAELKEKAIVPRFKRQEIVYCFSYGKIQLFNVVAYLDNQITLCENRETGKLEFVNNDYLCINEQEAQDKLKEIKGNGQGKRMWMLPRMVVW